MDHFCLGGMWSNYQECTVKCSLLMEFRIITIAENAFSPLNPASWIWDLLKVMKPPGSDEATGGHLEVMRPPGSNEATWKC